MRARDHFVCLEHPELGVHVVQRSEFRLSRAEGLHPWPAPREEIDALVAEEVLEVGVGGDSSG